MTPEHIAATVYPAATDLHREALDNVRRGGSMFVHASIDARSAAEKRRVATDLRRWLCVRYGAGRLELTRVGDELWRALTTGKAPRVALIGNGRDGRDGPRIVTHVASYPPAAANSDCTT